MKVALIVLGVLVLLGLVVGGQLIGVRNQLVTQQNEVEADWRQIDNVLQRRADLIPNLVATVKGFAAQEQSVIDSVTQARAAMMGAQTPADRMQANSMLDSALGRLMVVVENYPNIKSNENFLRLQDELAGTENRIAVERRNYNEAVQRYNTNIALFPNNIAASLFGFERSEYFQVEDGAREAPQVAF